MQGWIKLHRGLIEWEWYDHLPTKVLFIHLLLKANHKDNSYRGKIVKKGHLLTSRELLSKETGLSERQVRTALNHLKSTKEIAIKSSRQGTEIKIVKYSDYQETPNETPNKRPRSDQRTPSNKNDKKEKNEEEYYYIIDEKLKLSMDEYEKVRESYSPAIIDRNLFNVENYKGPKRKTYKNLYRVLLNFIKREENQQLELKAKKEAPKKEEYKYIRDHF